MRSWVEWHSEEDLKNLCLFLILLLGKYVLCVLDFRNTYRDGTLAVGVFSVNALFTLRSKCVLV